MQCCKGECCGVGDCVVEWDIAVGVSLGMSGLAVVRLSELWMPPSLHSGLQIEDFQSLILQQCDTVHFDTAHSIRFSTLH